MRKRLTIIASALGLMLGMGLAAAFMPAAHAATCTAALGGSCGPYSYAGIPMSNGYDTYVSNQSVGPQSGTTQTVNATDPGNWNVVAHDVPLGYGGVQSYVNVQQLMNDWNGSGWGSGSSDTPLSALSALKINYSESTPRDANTVAEWSPDVWDSNYSNDVMFWTDTQGRCNTGSYGGTILGTAVINGQTWTVNRYGGTGAEIIFVLDSNPAVPDSCAQQTSGTIDILAGMQWLVAHGYLSSLGNLTQLNGGWEICSANSTTFTMSSYSISATVNGSPPPTTPPPTTPPPTTPPPTTPPPTPTPTPTPTGTSERVTASVTNGWPGFRLKVLVLDGATEAGGAMASGQTTSGIAQARITPLASHSLPVFGLASGSAAIAYTAAANNAFYANTADSSQGWSYADGNYTGTIAAGSSITVGSSAPGGQYQAWAAYEVPGTGTGAPVVDAASPPGVQTSNASTETTAAFTPPAGSVLVALAEANGMGSGPNLGWSLTDTAGLHWTQRAVTAANNEGVSIWTAAVP